MADLKGGGGGLNWVYDKISHVYIYNVNWIINCAKLIPKKLAPNSLIISVYLFIQQHIFNQVVGKQM